MAGETICAETDCGRPVSRRGMCTMHYLRWWKATPREARIPAPKNLPDRERFDQKVSRSGDTSCWPWQGYRRESGHGVAVVEGVRIPAAAAALIFAGKPRPNDEAMALHRCDRPECVNPKHLYWGDYQSNSDDAWARGRHAVAEDRPASRLTNDQVIEIRQRYADGEGGPKLAEEFGIARPTLYQITSGNKWKSVGGPRTRRRGGDTHGE